MKQLKRTGIFKAANVSFDPTKVEAFSYGWWKFVSVVKGEVVFNNFSYSNSTRKHQWKVRALMNDLGIVIDRTVSFRLSLSGIDSVKELNRLQKAQDKLNAEYEEQKRILRNKRAAERRRLTREQSTALVTHAAHESHTSQMRTLRLVKGGVA